LSDENIKSLFFIIIIITTIVECKESEEAGEALSTQQKWYANRFGASTID
jgi:hypothetical protein